MRKQYIFIVSMFFLLFSKGHALIDLTNADMATSLKSQELTNLLEQAANYCEKLKNIALFFVCNEEVTEVIYDPYRILEASARRRWNSVISRLLYDYQLIRKDGKITESRSLLERNNVRMKLEQAKLETKRFWYKYIVFGPIGMFDKDTQYLHNYSIEKYINLWGRPAVIINVSPKDRVNASWLYGRVWLDKENGSTLKVEWEGEAMSDYGSIREIATDLNAKPIFKHFAEYKLEKNGVRFPSYFGIREEYEQVRPTFMGKYKLIKSELDVTYKDYKYFTVDTEIR